MDFLAVIAGVSLYNRLKVENGGYGHREKEAMTLRTRTAMRLCVILTFMGIVFSSPAFAQAGKVQAAVFLIGVQEPVVIRDFIINDNDYYDAIREGKPVKLPFQDLKEITFLNPGKNHETEVVFKDDRREKYTLKPASDITMISGSSIVSMGHTKVARIAFSPMPVQPPPTNAPPVLQQPRPGAQPGALDRVVLKSGDILSGNVQTTIFPVRTAYGTFRLEMPKIASIEFDEKGPNTAVVLLRNGDRLSGTVEADPVLFVMTSGEGIQFDGKTIKSIQFKR